MLDRIRPGVGMVLEVELICVKGEFVSLQEDKAILETKLVDHECMEEYISLLRGKVVGFYVL